MNPQRAGALLLALFAIYLLRSIKTDLRAGPLVKESYPSFDTNYDIEDPSLKYARSEISAVENVAPGEDVKDDLLPNEGYQADYSYDQMLIESVVSIIQGYYVDSARVSNVDLFAQSIDVLKSVIPTYKEENGYINFKEGNKEFRVRNIKKKTMSYASLLTHIASHHRIAQTILSKRGSDEEYVIVRGILQNLDAHSAMLLPEDYQELKQGTEGVFGGLGVLVGMRDELLTVIKPIPKSPAQRIGIKRNDKILSIDGHKTYGSTLDKLVEHMRGAPGTKVELEVLKEEAPSAQKISLTREVIHVDSVSSKTIMHGNKEYLYLAIESFASRTTDEISSAIKSFRKKHGGKMPGLILDLRSNPGGLLDQAITVADLFLGEGVIVSTRGRKNEVENATAGSHETDFPMTVLINSDSASASEIVAGALQDHGRALVIGQQSFGKGSVQTVFELPGQRAIKLTIARYYTPKGRTIQNEGITPDIVFQPVFKKDENLNLLGNYRYRGEGALSHALSTKSFLEANNSRALYQSFYLTTQESEDDYTSGTDKEFQLSKLFLSAVNKHYGDEIPKGMRRVDHQLFVASKEINGYLNSQFSEVKKFLAGEFKVDWGGKKFGSEGITLQLMTDPRIPVVPGKKAVIPVRIFNDSESEINNVSLSVQTEEAGLISKELLVGKIAAKSELKTNFVITTPPYWNENIVEGIIHLAVNGKLTNKRVKFKFDVKNRVPAVLSALISLVSEKGGKLKGTLEENERAKIQVEIVNNSDAPANSTDVKLLNLSGKQITLSADTQQSISIPPKGRKKVYFDIAGSEKLYDHSIVLGVYLDSSDLVSPYRKELKINGRPGVGGVKNAQLYSH